MDKSNPPSRKPPAWKAAAGPSSASRPVDEAWRNTPVSAAPKAPWWKARKARIAFVTSALLVVAVAIVVVALWPRRVKPMHLVLIGTGYEDNLFVPHAVQGYRGLRDLEKLAEENNNWGGQRTFVPLGGDPDAVRRALEVPLLERAPKMVVVFVSAHGLSRSQEGGFAPCFVPADDNLADAAALYRLDDLLDALAKLPQETKKLLLVDATQAGACWPLGQLHNDFARALQTRRGRIEEMKNLVVISSSDEDQRSWVSPEWGQTYFAHFVIEGLKGAADGGKTGNGDSRVDAWELYEYVRAKVELSAWHNRARKQTPVLLGRQEVAKNMELVACGAYQANDDVGETDGERHKEALEKAWGECRELRKASPHPAAYAPHLWRRYLDTLLRAEQLARAGDDTAAKLLGNLKDLHRDIERSRSLELPSAQLTLAMPEALGLRLAAGQAELNRVEKLWTESAAKREREEYDKARSALLERAGKTPLGRQLLQAALGGRVLRNLAEEPQEHLAYGRESLEALDAIAPDCRTAEAHYLLMMLRPEDESKGLPPPIAPLLEQKPRCWPLLRKALQVRLLAEQAALGLGGEGGANLPAYSEQVLPWIREIVEKADGRRRLGQDLLFTSDPARWDEADRLLDDAEKDYRRAQELAVNIRRALDVRYRVQAELPYYTHWVAERGPEHEKFAIELWGRLHELRRRLDKPESGEAAVAQAAELDRLRHGINESFRQMHGWVEASASEKIAHHQGRWHEIEAALAVPFLEPDVRASLIAASRAISRDLFEKGSDAPDLGGESAQASAVRHGKLALAVLGREDWDGESKYETVENAIKVPEEGAWYRSLTRAGEGVGGFLNRMPEDADKLYGRALQAPKLEDAAESLRTAVRHARRIPGAAGLTRMKQDPVAEQRRLDTHHLLCWQAHRAFLDWWAELNQTAQTTPYYRRAAEMFLKDAERLAAGTSAKANAAERSPRLRRVDAEYADLRDSAPLVVQRSEHRSEEDFRPGPARFHLTDEQDVKWSYRLRGPDRNKVPGHPVVWVGADRGLQVAAKDARWRIVEFGSRFDLDIAEDGPAGRPPSGVARHQVKGFFRGHRSAVETAVHMPIKPDRIVSLPPLWGPGRVAVQTEKDLYALLGSENAAVALVLDCSGSMNTEPPDNSRFKKALRALRSVLKRLPEGVTVSLRTFGALQHINEQTNPHGIKLVWPARPWVPDQLDTFMERVEKLKPWGFTPLVRSIALAKRDLPRDKAARSIVVITDGGDSTFYKDRVGRTGDTIKRFLQREFADSDIQVSVIGFEVKESELREDEKDGYREFPPALQAIHGLYYDAEDNEQLRDRLMRSLLHMYFQVYPDIGRDLTDLRDVGENISQSDKHERPRWVAKTPDFYRIRVPSVRSLQRRVYLGPGDALLLDLVRGRNGWPEFRRAMYAESDYIRHKYSRVWRGKSQENWLLAVLQNSPLDGGPGLQLMATLEKYPDPRSSPEFLQQIHPHWVWFEVPAPDGADKTPPPLHVTSLPDYPADAWGLDVSDWPPERASTLKTWWIEGSPAPRAQLLKKSDFQETPLELGTRSWLNDPQLGTITLEGVEWKRWEIKVDAQRTREVSCLVVRLSYPPDKEPFFVRLRNDPKRKIGVENRIGEQHRFYARAGKYTGVFGPISQEDVPTVEGLELFSVAQLKEKALCVEKLKLEPPNDRWKRPGAAGSSGE